MRRRVAAAALALGAAGLGLGGRCGGGSGSGGAPPVVRVESLDPRCLALAAPFPAGYDFVPSRPGQVLVTNDFPQTILRFDVQQVPFRAPPGAALALPGDADGDGLGDIPSPRFADLAFAAPDLALVPTSSYEAVLFVDSSPALRTFDVQVPASLAPTLFPLLPPPGSGAPRTGIATFACVAPPPGALDSRGGSLASLPAAGLCPAGTFLTSFTASAAISGGRLFVATSNLGADQGTDHTQFFPGTVLVFDVDLAATPPRVAPHPGTPVLFTSAFNPSHVTPYTTPGGRDLLLVTETGAIGIVRDDPSTRAVEGGTVGLTDGAVDVVDPAGPALVATIPLRGANPSLRGPALDPGGRVALLGDVLRRNLYAIDLEPLDGLGPPGGPPVVLDGSMGANALVFDGASPFRIPERVNGAPMDRCPGSTSGVAVNAAGSRVYVVEQCDGTLASVSMDLSGAPPVPVPQARFGLLALDPITAALRDDAVGQPQLPDAVRVRPGRPGVDFSGPDVFFTVGTPEGMLCGLNVESP